MTEYLDFAGLHLYDELIKALIKSGHDELALRINEVLGGSDVEMSISDLISAINIINGDESVTGSFRAEIAKTLGAKIVTDVNELFAPMEKPYKGMFGFLDSSDSEDDGSLYVLMSLPNTTPGNWKRILGGGGFPDTSHVITTDGTAPVSGSGISINGSLADGFSSITYIDNANEIKADGYYTSDGLNTQSSNGGQDTPIDDYIILLNPAGNSSITLYGSGDNWIQIDFANANDDSLGFKLGDVTYIDENGNVQPYVNHMPLPKGTPVSFGNDVSFNGMMEIRANDPRDLTFGTTGSTYEDLDIYSEEHLPNVYAYSDGTSTRILTEGDKDEILNELETGLNNIITEPEIIDLFTNNI